MSANMSEGSFIYGSELQGRGYATQTDLIVGITIWIIAVLAIVFGIINIFVVWKMPIFHNSFGAIWMTRTIGEVGANIVHVVYSAPVTAYQPVLPPIFGIIAFTSGLFLACEACVMHQIVATNRLVAVCFPVRYRTIFSKRNTAIIIGYCWIEVAAIMSLYYVIPCSIIGYSPKFYEYIFIKCDANDDRDYSLAGTIVNRSCFVLCSIASLTDAVTLSKIIHIRVANKIARNNSNFNRDVRFFAQTAVQNLTMMISCAAIVIANNGAMKETVYISILAFDTLILTHLSNSLVLVLFNREVRHYLGLHAPCTKEQIESTTGREFIGRDT
ncbi:hypothetical protein QR680_014759 [Steinernema hermaphroditum]|uniref:7TM GPCR serpentine receptor class x (Srx) domain-containing protein n=1 Tax=Steinernema hermaphroditum TaxID=289476 RepID=A0AA39IA01_9BILA|nr:hypothetical protein QR680_014759 [Steinernema hermaphroditum]